MPVNVCIAKGATSKALCEYLGISKIHIGGSHGTGKHDPAQHNGYRKENDWHFSNLIPDYYSDLSAVFLWT